MVDWSVQGSSYETDNPDLYQTGPGVGSSSSGVSPVGAIGGAVGAVGAGLSIAGANGEYSAQQSESNISQGTAALEEQINQQRMQQMVLTAQRQELQNYRNTQKARAMAVAAGVNQGAGTGSGVPGGGVSSGVAGGLAGASATGAFNNLGITQNLQIGETIGGLTSNIDQNQIQMAQQQSKAATYAGLSSLGSSLSSASGGIGALASLAPLLLA